MAVKVSQSRVSRHSIGDVDPTPLLHSPRPSLGSTAPSRTTTPLTLHEYRKQQHDTAVPANPPPGRRLRRKAAAPALNELEYAPLARRIPPQNYLPPSQRLQPSRSAVPLTSLYDTNESSPKASASTGLLDSPFRSQSAEPFGTAAWRNKPDTFSHRSNLVESKVGNWKPIKRLPKPLKPPLPTSPTLPVYKLPFEQHSSLTPSSPSSTDNLLSCGARTESSNVSLSLFPRPPHLIHAPLSPPDDNFDRPQQHERSFASTAPVTPPATPAVIHYRGTSFDLINPHDSLLLHDIETPSRGFDSTEYLPLSVSADRFHLDHNDMTARGRLFEDFSSAFNSIAKKENEVTDPDICSPPAARLPLGSGRDSLSPVDHHARSLASIHDFGKRSPESRFSLKQLAPLKQLTRTFTRKMEHGGAVEEQELYELRQPRISQNSVATSNTHGGFARSQHTSDITEASDQPLIGSAYTIRDPSLVAADDDSGPFEDSYSLPLTSMIPDEPSSQMGRANGDRLSTAMTDPDHRPYYDEVSIYPSSSVYDQDSEYGLSGLLSQRASRRISRLSEPLAIRNVNDGPSLYSPIGNATPRKDVQNFGSIASEVRTSEEKTDTISRLIAEYRQDLGMGNGNSPFDDPLPASKATADSPAARAQPASSSGIYDMQYLTNHPEVVDTTRGPGPPPLDSAPQLLSPQRHAAQTAFAQATNSDMMSASSYGDTRALLQTPRNITKDNMGDSQKMMTLNTLAASSSYSQGDDPSNSRTPEEALIQAEQIFEEAALEGRYNVTPSAWFKRGTDDLMLQEESAAPGDGKDEWETIEASSRRSHVSDGSSIADYSSSEGSRSVCQMSPKGSLPFPEEAYGLRKDSSLYRHPSPIATHDNPFSSSPPVLSDETNHIGTPRQSRSLLLPSSPPHFSNSPLARGSGLNRVEDYTTSGLRQFPWPTTSPYTLSEKETRELLISGPNDDILYDDVEGYSRTGDLSSSPFDGRGTGRASRGGEFANSFEKFTVLGSKVNLTGSPGGTGMHAVGSSIANTSSPGATWQTEPVRRSPRSGSEFYIESDCTSSFTPIHGAGQPRWTPEEHERSPSQETLFPSHHRMRTLLGRSGKRPSVSRSMHSAAGRNRSAVAGQTKLREMVLASDARTISTCRSDQFSNFHSRGGSERPSSSNTHTPLRGLPTHYSLSVLRNGPVASKESPHLLCPERACNPADEVTRWNLSWGIFALFCLFPPAIILYRWLGDLVITELTKGRFGSCAPRPKQVATYAGIIVNVGIVIAIIVPITYMHLNGSL
ncbi:hypothetical protein BU24DRAFT_449315 [Aaosphaeria arxii CBS 175.79]|uniref:Uncharacterized protein n=1 Tax=Aaosphaeria arxii CBS 175.79 TaxID=1450172 RepID=A0A6A5XXY8_9PLEO|nr:uncharacterized protein BU24DRAFT_449315 [Aaosphaeria arxii CBS 175.79]KAF2017697.1 hypothetical protein BU24DRAFT_449315 [Aaosphaeria arxii CBS 175.79]